MQAFKHATAARRHTQIGPRSWLVRDGDRLLVLTQGADRALFRPALIEDVRASHLVEWYGETGAAALLWGERCRLTLYARPSGLWALIAIDPRGDMIVIETLDEVIEASLAAGDVDRFNLEDMPF